MAMAILVAQFVFVLLLATSSILEAQSSVVPRASCADVDRVLTPCIPYLSDRVLHPTPLCCAGATAARRMASVTDDDRAAVCECIKSWGAQLIGLDSTRAVRLPTLCGIHVSMPISASVNCSSIPPAMD